MTTVRQVVAMAMLAVRLIARDRLFPISTLLLPIVLLLVLPGLTGEGALAVGVVDQAPREVSASLAETASLDVVRYPTDDAVRRAVERGEIAAGLTVTDEQAMAVIGAFDRPLSRAAVTLVESAIGGDDERPGVRVEPVDALRPRDDTNAHVVPAAVVLSMFLTAMTTASFLVEERRAGVWARLGVLASTRVVVVGQLLARVVVALVQGAFVGAVGTILHDVAWGPVGLVVAFLVVAALTAGAAGMLVGLRATTLEQAVALGALFGLATGVVGGAFWPIDGFEPALRAAAALTPQRWSIDGLQSLNAGGSVDDHVLGCLGLLAVQAAVLGGVALREARASGRVAPCP